MLFDYCPLESRFIDNAEQARAYYYFRLVLAGPHQITSPGRAPATVFFNAEEIHAFSSGRPIAGAVQIARPGPHAREVRYFDRERARRLDQILDTLKNPARALPAKTLRGVMVYGPPRDGAPRMCVVVAPEGSSGRWFVRSAFPVSADDFRRALQASGSKGAKWPP